MNILTVSISGITEVQFNEFNKYIWIHNKTDNAVYASLTNNVASGVEGTTEIPGKESGLILMSDDRTIYISGSGSVEIKASDFAECPFKVSGRGGDKLVRYLGITTTPLYDGASVNPILIDGNSVTAKSSDWAVYASADYLFNGSVWQKCGDFENYYTKTETDTLLSAKANSADVYTKTQSDDKYIAKSDIVNTPTIAEINASINTIWG